LRALEGWAPGAQLDRLAHAKRPGEQQGEPSNRDNRKQAQRGHVELALFVQVTAVLPW
jgi:hypothetical protein